MRFADMSAHSSSETAAMTSPAGSRSASAVIGKRKRSLEASESDATIAGSPQNPAALLQDVLLDALTVLQEHDTIPSTLDYPLPSSATQTPPSKRAKTASSPSRSIADKIQDRSYENVADLRADFGSVLTSIGSRNGAVAANGRIKNFRSELETVLQELEGLRRTSAGNAQTTAVSTIKQEDDADKTVTMPPKSHGPVLTVFGAAPNNAPKRAFASLRDRLDHFEGDADKASVLPKGVTLEDFHRGREKVVSSSDRPKSTFGQLFRPRNSLPLELPRAVTRHSRRPQPLAFAPSSDLLDTAPRASMREAFYNQPMNSGSWVSSYAGTAFVLSKEAELEKKGQASSRRPRPNQPTLKEALFKRAFSSFGPSTDNATPVISAQLRSRLWWQQYGWKRANKDVDGEGKPSQDLPEPETSSNQLDNLDDEARQFREAVESFEEDQHLPAAIDPELADQDQRPSGCDRETSEMLAEINSLIQSLQSFQRNRLLEAAGAGSAGDKPSEHETQVHDVLRQQLTLIIQTLPPHLVSRIDGDRLAALNLSTKLRVSGPTYAGVLPDPDAHRPPPPNAGGVPGDPRSVNRPGQRGSVGYAQPGAPSPAPHSARASYSGAAGRPNGAPTMHGAYGARPPSSTTSYGQSYSASPAAARLTPAGSYSGQSGPASASAAYGGAQYGGNATRLATAAPNGYGHYRQYGTPSQATSPGQAAVGYQRSPMTSTAAAAYGRSPPKHGGSSHGSQPNSGSQGLGVTLNGTIGDAVAFSAEERAAIAMRGRESG